jgi:multidrug resistance efflux pump
MDVSGLKAIKHKIPGNRGSGPNNVHKLQEQLKLAHGASPQPIPSSEPSEAPPEIAPANAPSKPPRRAWRSRLSKTLIALAVLGVVVWAPVSVMLQASSAEAVINARLAVIRAPIEGEIIAQYLPAAGEAIAGGRSLLRIENSRIDHTAVESLKQQITGLLAERPAIIQRLAGARAEAEDLAKQVDAFSKARISVLNVDLQILDQTIRAEQERQTLAVNDASRVRALRKAGVVAQSAAEKAASGEVIAVSALTELKLRRERLVLERQAMANGLFVGDSYNDRPQSAQLHEEVKNRIAGLEADLAANLSTERGLQASLNLVQSQQDTLSQAQIIAPQNARIWQMLVTPGEQVVRGQEIARLFSCDAAVVTAAVSESVYNKLYSGMPAQFIPRGTRESLPGTIVNLTGMAEASSNYAINPSALIKEPHRVTVSVPALASANDCTIGRTGRVMFGDAALQSAPGRFLTALSHYLP